MREFAWKIRTRTVCALRGHRWLVTGLACMGCGIVPDADRWCCRCGRHEELRACRCNEGHPC